MHSLLTIEKRLTRLRRRRDEIAAWHDRDQRDLQTWTFDGSPIELGDLWPSIAGVHRFESCVFEVPVEWPLEVVRLGLDVGGESLLHICYASGKETIHGLDLNHTDFHLEERQARVVVEAVAKGPFGTISQDPRLKRAELVLLEPAVVEMSRLLGLVADAVQYLEGHEAQSLLLDLAENAIARLKWPTATEAVLSRKSRFTARWGRRESDRELPTPALLDREANASVVAAIASMRSDLRALKARFPKQGRVALIGHAHLDTAWLWTIEETRRKVQRTFATVVDLMDRSSEFRFVQSFAEYYRGLEEENPALLARVKSKVSTGQWEPVGGFWVEPDINMPCGESLVRQALYGQRYFEQTFGKRHAVAWLPDTFGFSPALPQILKRAGLDALFTIKIGWSETNKFPHTRFWWEGIDGSRVLVQHMNTPEDTYNGLVDASTLLRAWRNHSDKHIAGEVLQPIGYGDGGGGPTEQMIQAQAYLDDFPVVPEARFTSAQAFFTRALAEAKERTPATWVGELYLEYHRGTLTTQGRTKSLLRRAERDLIGAEVLQSLAWMAGGKKPEAFAEAWRSLLVNQFHDILPGSSIGEVYGRTERELGEVVTVAKAGASAALNSIATSLEIKPGDDALLVVNPDLSERILRLTVDRPFENAQQVEEGYVVSSDEKIGPLAIRAGHIEPPACPAEATARSLENRFLRVEFDDKGTLARVFDKRFERDVLSGRGNQLWAWRDQPREYDAWDIDEDYRRAGDEILAREVDIVERGPHRSALRIVRKIGQSTITQHVRLWANSPRLDFHTKFDWHDRRLLIQAIFPVLVRSDFATFECAFGSYRRPTHRNTSWDAARFEVAAHRFVDLSEYGYGVALLNDGRYGHHVFGNELGISLLRSPTLPDGFADEGEQSLTYALYPHAGGWYEGGVLGEAEDLNRPLFSKAVRAGEKRTQTLIGLSGTNCALGALKRSEDGDDIILRVYEPAGARGPVTLDLPPNWQVVGETDLLEDGVESSGPIGPFEIRSFRLRAV